MGDLYETRVTARGGRQGGVRSEDGLLELRLAVPKAMGGTGDATNPEQLFAAGYAACFESAILHANRSSFHKIDEEDLTVTAEVGVRSNDVGGFALSVALTVTMANSEQKAAEKLVASAHRICPYSNALRGNVDVKITVLAGGAAETPAG